MSDKLVAAEDGSRTPNRPFAHPPTRPVCDGLDFPFIITPVIDVSNSSL